MIQLMEGSKQDDYSSVKPNYPSSVQDFLKTAIKEQAMALISKPQGETGIKPDSSSELMMDNAKVSSQPAAVETSLGVMPTKWKYTGEQFMAVCPVCKKKSIQNGIDGKVKGGISIVKTATALTTMGISALFTGLRSSKKTKYYECRACGAVYER